MKLFFKCLGGVAMTLILNSCDWNDNGYSLGDVWYSLATVKPLNDGKAYSLRLDKGTTLWPAATKVPYYKPKENQRALVYYTILSDKFEGYDHAIQVHNIRNILTKPFVEHVKPDSVDKKYGKDPLKIVNMWVGDGYLNVEFGFNYGGTKTHFINLLHQPKDNDPYFFELRHHAYGDPQRYGRKGLVAFDLSKLNTDKNKEVTLTILVKTFKGEKKYTVKYNEKKVDVIPYSIKEKDLNEIDFVATK